MAIMTALDMLRGLYDYNEWANGHVLECASALTAEELSREQGASFGSVERNLAHILGAQVVWLARWRTGRNPDSLAELQSMRGLPAIRDAFDSSHRELRAFLASVSAANVEGVLHYTDSRGDAHEMSLWKLMAHVVNHGTHHRAETAMALSALGKPMRELDYSFFEAERAAAGGS